MEDIKTRSKLAQQWLFEQYNIFLEDKSSEAKLNYDSILETLLTGVLEEHDSKEGFVLNNK